jgi:hypothetical protein
MPTNRRNCFANEKLRELGAKHSKNEPKKLEEVNRLYQTDPAFRKDVDEKTKKLQEMQKERERGGPCYSDSE